MRVIAAGQKEIIISMDVIEFEKMTNISVGDYYGNGGVSYSKLTDMKFDLSKTLDAIYQLKVANECKDKVKENLKNMISRIDNVCFPLPEMKEYKSEASK